MYRVVLVMALCAAISACGKDKGSPTQPTPSETASRVIGLSGDLSFGDVEVGATVDRTLRVSNSGNVAMAVTSLSVTTGSPLTASWLAGVIPAGGTQDITMRFTPTASGPVSGTIRVNADHTAGSNQTTYSGRGVRTGPVWAYFGGGNTVFDMPTTISRVRVVGTYTGNSSNFIVRIGGRLVVNELVGRSWNQERYEGVHATTGGTVEITNSSGVQWSFTEVRE